MGNIAPQRHEKCVSEVINVKVDMRSVLDTGELLSGTPTVAEVDDTDLTIQNNIVNTATLTINDDTVAVGEAVQFRVSGGVAH